jgi:hypothetical protein
LPCCPCCRVKTRPTPIVLNSYEIFSTGQFHEDYFSNMPAKEFLAAIIGFVTPQGTFTCKKLPGVHLFSTCPMSIH